MKHLKSISTYYQPWIDVLLVTSLAVISLILWSFFDTTKVFHFNILRLNDQINYLTTARNLLYESRLDSSLIFIGTLTEEFTKNTFYMPGYPFVLGLSYRLFGYGVFQSLLPSLLAFVGGVILTFLITKDMFGRKAAWISAIIFLVFPFYVLFAYVAMMEMVFIFLVLLTYYLFTHLKPRYRWIFGPFLVVPVFLVRETGALLLLPMALYMLVPDWRNSLKETLMFCTITLLILGVIYISPLSAGRPTSPFIYILKDLPLYDDIAANSDSFSIPLLGRLFLERVKSNLRTANELETVEILSLGLILSGGLLIMVFGLIKKRAINFVFSVVILILAATLAVILFYDIAWFRGVRMLLFTSPFAIIAWGGVLAALSEDLPRKYKYLPWVVGIVLVALLLNQSFNLIQTMTSPKMIEFEQASIGFIENLNHDDQNVLVAPLDVAIAYVDNHYPVKYAFLPVSKPALNILAEKFNIGTVIYPVRITRKKHLQPEDLLELGMILEQQIDFKGQEYLIFKPSN